MRRSQSGSQTHRTSTDVSVPIPTQHARPRATSDQQSDAIGRLVANYGSEGWGFEPPPGAPTCIT